MMKKFTNFQLYIPDNEQQKQILEINPEIVFLQSGEGADWYECQKAFADDTMKIVYDQAGIVLSFSTDASTLWPVGASVAEIPVDEIPEDLAISGDWVFDGIKIVPRAYTPEELQQRAESQKQKLLAQASEKIAPLQDAAELDIATDEEKNRLLAWKKYRVLLNRIDTAIAPDITWPAQPA
ncbi:tail fiber assembly protein [[Erwinia] mediterraneensis]|uniref:tail fiber assembly protein n=1 Tax=[Erwinia] mediterraneensis TaxID=2161819 RepID=UPI002351C48F|nr:tail fiber assembly protein [[Erwinia] mediterraneensis]